MLQWNVNGVQAAPLCRVGQTWRDVPFSKKFGDCWLVPSYQMRQPHCHVQVIYCFRVIVVALISLCTAVVSFCFLTQPRSELQVELTMQSVTCLVHRGCQQPNSLGGPTSYFADYKLAACHYAHIDTPVITSFLPIITVIMDLFHIVTVTMDPLFQQLWIIHIITH